jgi:hypothetical protein
MGGSPIDAIEGHSDAAGRKGEQAVGSISGGPYATGKACLATAASSCREMINVLLPDPFVSNGAADPEESSLEARATFHPRFISAVLRSASRR